MKSFFVIKVSIILITLCTYSYSQDSDSRSSEDFGDFESDQIGTNPGRAQVQSLTPDKSKPESVQVTNPVPQKLGFFVKSTIKAMGLPSTTIIPGLSDNDNILLKPSILYQGDKKYLIFLILKSVLQSRV